MSHGYAYVIMMYFGQSNFLSLPLIVWAKWKRSTFLFLSFYWTFSRFFFLSFYLNELSQCFSLHDCNYWGNRIIMILKINFFISMKVKFLSQWSLDLSYRNVWLIAKIFLKIFMSIFYKGSSFDFDMSNWTDISSWTKTKFNIFI